MKKIIGLFLFTILSLSLIAQTKEQQETLDWINGKLKEYAQQNSTYLMGDATMFFYTHDYLLSNVNSERGNGLMLTFFNEGGFKDNKTGIYTNSKSEEYQALSPNLINSVSVVYINEDIENPLYSVNIKSYNNENVFLTVSKENGEEKINKVSIIRIPFKVKDKDIAYRVANALTDLFTSYGAKLNRAEKY